MKIRIPRISNNDDYVILGSWCVNKGAYIKKGQVLAILETTKETRDLVAEEAGYISYDVSEGSEVEVGAVIAELMDMPLSMENEESHTDTDKMDHISQKAMELIKKHGIDITKLPADKIIREKDILKLIEEHTTQKQSPANEILIVCGGNIARMCIDTIRLMGGYRLGGITDIYAETGTMLMGVPYIGDIDVLAKKYEEGHRTAVNAYGGVVSSISDPLFFARKKIYEEIKEYQFFMPNLIHPKANVETSATMGEGNLVFSGAYIGSEAFIGNDCLINTGAMVSHNCTIGDHSRISPGAVLAGDVSVGENTIVGMGVTVYMGVHIGRNVIIYNGKHIFNDVPDNTIVK